MSRPNWIPLESNPQMLTTFAHSLGVKDTSAFHDVWGLEEELLNMVPKPSHALLLLYPHSAVNEKKGSEIDDITANGQVVSENVFFLRQLIGNACGTIAAIHALANVASKIEIGDGFLRSYIDETKAMSPMERGKHLQKSESIQQVHEEVAVQGQTEAPEADDDVDYHFIAFVAVDGHVYELDGVKPFPINHGPTTDDTFILDAAKVIREKFIAHAGDAAGGFSVISLGPPASDDE